MITIHTGAFFVIDMCASNEKTQRVLFRFDER